MYKTINDGSKVVFNEGVQDSVSSNYLMADRDLFNVCAISGESEQQIRDLNLNKELTEQVSRIVKDALNRTYAQGSKVMAHFLN